MASGIVTTTVALALLASVARVAAEPLMVTYRTGVEVQGLRTVLAQERSANAGLTDDIAYLKTRAGVEQEARRRGWVRPGEVALFIVDSNAPEAEEVTVEEPAAPQRMSVADRIRTTLESCLAVFGSKDRS
ncbi:MAG: FtsB family cell division protein [Armatimonadota bacterium]